MPVNVQKETVSLKCTPPGVEVQGCIEQVHSSWGGSSGARGLIHGGTHTVGAITPGAQAGKLCCCPVLLLPERLPAPRLESTPLVAQSFRNSLRKRHIGAALGTFQTRDSRDSFILGSSGC